MAVASIVTIKSSSVSRELPPLATPGASYAHSPVYICSRYADSNSGARPLYPPLLRRPLPPSAVPAKGVRPGSTGCLVRTLPDYALHMLTIRAATADEIGAAADRDANADASANANGNGDNAGGDGGHRGSG